MLGVKDKGILLQIIKRCNRVIEKVSNISGLNELTMTTNGSLLKYYASQLKSAGVSRLNISLDTLNPTRFNQITSTESYNEVLEGIKEAQKCGFKGIKINCVLIGGFNDDEIKDFVSLTKDNDIVVRFIELMPIGESANWQSDKFVSPSRHRLLPKGSAHPRWQGYPEGQSHTESMSFAKYSSSAPV